VDTNIRLDTYMVNGYLRKPWLSPRAGAAQEWNRGLAAWSCGCPKNERFPNLGRDVV